MSSQRLKRNGLTILELMTSAVIASILLTGMLGISVSMFKQKNSLNEIADQLTDGNALYQLLEFDLSNSRFITFTGSRLELIGYASKSGAGEPLQKSTKVIYELNQIGTEQFLVRNQLVEGELNGRKDLVGHQIAGIDLLEFDVKTNRWNSLLWNRQQGKRMSIPDVVRIQVFKKGNKNPFIDEVFSFNVIEGT